MASICGYCCLFCLFKILQALSLAHSLRYKDSTDKKIEFFLSSWLFFLSVWLTINFHHWLLDDLIVDPRNFEWMREANCPVVSKLFHFLYLNLLFSSLTLTLFSYYKSKNYLCWGNLIPGKQSMLSSLQYILMCLIFKNSSIEPSEFGLKLVLQSNASGKGKKNKKYTIGRFGWF